MIHMQLFPFKLIKMEHNLEFSSSVTLATLQVLDVHMRLVVTMLDSAEGEHFQHCRKLYWTAL